MTPSQQAQSAVQEAVLGGAKASPAATIAGVHYLLDRPIEFWVSIAVLVYTVLQIAVLVRDKFLRDKL